MPGRVRRVFDRYAARHLALSQPGPEILDGQGRKIGRVESITLHNDRLVVRGQCRADHMALELGGRRRLGGARSLAGGQGFHMELPQEPGPAVLWFSLDGQSQSLTLPDGTLTEQGRAVIASIRDGELSPTQGATLLTALGALAKLTEADDLERRIAALEAKP